MTRANPERPAGPWAIFDHLLDAVLIVDRERRLHYFNESFRNLGDVSPRAISNREEATKYIELPDECWAFAEAEGHEGSGYREVGFITKSGSMGRVQVMTGSLMLPEMNAEPLTYLILRDVTVEARLHAKYKVQIEANERLIGDLQRTLSETTFLKRLANELPAYAETATLLHAIGERLKTELEFRDAHFFYLPEKAGGALESVSFDKRIGSRLREVVRDVNGLRHLPRDETVSSVVHQPFGVFWLTLVRSRLERPILLIASAKDGQEKIDHRNLLESLSGQVATLLDNRAMYFASITDSATGLFSRRFFDSRFDIECVRASERRSPLTVLLMKINDYATLAHTQTAATSSAAGAALIAAAVAAAKEAPAKWVPTPKVVTNLEALVTKIGETIKRRIRDSDVGAALGNGEFGILLPDTTVEDGARVAESLRVQIAAITVGNLQCAVSVGLAGYEWSSDQPAQAMQRARTDLEMSLAARAS